MQSNETKQVWCTGSASKTFPAVNLWRKISLMICIKSFATYHQSHGQCIPQKRPTYTFIFLLSLPWAPICSCLRLYASGLTLPNPPMQKLTLPVPWCHQSPPSPQPDEQWTFWAKSSRVNWFWNVLYIFICVYICIHLYVCDIYRSLGSPLKMMISNIESNEHEWRVLVTKSHAKLIPNESESRILLASWTLRPSKRAFCAKTELAAFSISASTAFLMLSFLVAMKAHW